MRILHTSDWHLGQHFMGRSRQREHAALLQWITQQVQAHDVDAVIIAGDIFDTAAPPSYARELYHQLIASLHATGTALLVLGGNHDSVSVLGESQPLLHHLNTTVIAHTGAPEQHVVVLPRRTAAGEPYAPGCIVCALPFIRARDVQTSLPGQSMQDKQQGLLDAIRTTYANVYAVAQARQTQLQHEYGVRVPIVATGHLTTLGTSRTESVREIYVGTLDAFPTDAFPPADYIALGHIHQPQQVGSARHIQYSGSPLALGFDELGQRKQVLLVDLNAEGLQDLTALPVPVWQPMASVQGTLQSLPAQLQALAHTADKAQPTWLEITVQQDDYLPDLAARVEALVQDLPLQVLRIRRQRAASRSTLHSTHGESLQELDPLQVFERRLALEELPPPLHDALHTRYRSVLEAVQHSAPAQSACQDPASAATTGVQP